MPPENAQVTLTASYMRPFQMHGALGPSAALALMQENRLTAWTHSQGVFPLRAALSQVLAMPPEAIRIVHVEGPGCYGHNGADDVVLDAALVARGELWVDSRQAALSESGDIVLAIMEGAIDEHHIAGELGAFVASASRRKDNRLTIFKSLGMAVEDVAAAHLAFSKARQVGRGQVIAV